MAQESLNLPYLALSGTLLLTLIVSFTVFRPQLQQWQETRAEISKLEEQLRERQSFLITIDQKITELRANAAYDQELSVLLPDKEAFADVLRLIDRQAGASGVQIKNVDNVTITTQTADRVARALGDETGTPDTLTVHGATIRLQGAYQQIRQFLGHLENAARFMDISNISVSQVVGQPELLEGIFTTEFYSLAPK